MKKLIISLFLGFSLSLAYAQQSVSIGTTDTKTNAVLYLKGDGNQGLIIPVTSNHSNVPVTEGMIVYDKSDGKIYKCDGTAWTPIEGSGTGSDSQTLTINGNNLLISGGNSVAIAGAAPTQAGQLLMWDGSKWTTSSATAPTTGQVLKWNSTTSKWEAGTDNGSAYTAGTGISITGNTITNTGDTDATNDITTSSTAAGDLTGTFSNLTIGSGAVTATKIANGAVGVTQLANGPFNNVLTTDGTGKPTWAPGGSGVTSVTATLPLATSGTAIAPIITFPSWPGNATGALTNNGSGTLSWQVPATSGTAGGDLTGTYPNPTVSNGAISGGTGGKIADATITGADLATNIVISTTGSITAGTISGAGSGITAIDATNIASGTLPIARGGTGLATTPTNGQVLIGNGTGYTLSTLTAGSGVTVTNGAGTISIASTGLTNPMTTVGDIIVGNASGTPARLAGSAGFLKSTGAALPSWTPLAAADIPVLDASKISTGTLPVTRGGTGITSVTNGGVPYGAAGNFAFTPVGTAGQVLTSNGAAAPTWSNAGLSSTLPSANILVGNISNVATAVPVSGDASIANTGAITLSNSASTRTNLGLGSFATLTNPLTTTGDIIYGTIATPTRLGIGTLGQVLVVAAGGLPAWQTAPSPFVTANVIPKGNGSTLVASQIFDSGTNVGIGTTGPTQLLDVFGGSINTNKDYMIGGTAVLKDGGSNVIVGDLTPAVTVGSQNSIVGSQAGQVMSGAAADNTINGFQAGSSLTTGASNTFMGSKAGSRTTGSFNTFIGSIAGVNHTTGNYNTLIGVGSDIQGAGAYSNSVAIGHNAYAGADNVMALGGTTLADAVNVGINTSTPTERLHVVGNIKFTGALMPNNLPGSSGQVLTSGGAGVAPTWTNASSGWGLTGNAGTVSTTNFIGTTDNVALKFKTNNNISGLIDPLNSNAFFGYIAGQTTTGQQNVAIGTNSLTSNTAGGRNTAVGTAALSNTTGSGNIGIGMSSLSTNTTGSNNTAIGFGADVVSGNLTNATAIGLNSKVAQSNAMALGGTGVDAVNVGINTTSPTERLDVVGNLKFSGALLPNNLPGTAGQVLTSAGGGLPPTWTTGGTGWGLTGNGGTSPTTNFIGTTDLKDFVFRTNNIEALRISTTGNLGIGTITPGSKLDVVGTSSFVDNTTTATGYSTIIQNNIAGSGISGGALQVTNSGARSINNDAMSIQNLADKSGGSGSTKTGLSILSTGAWAPGTGQPNRGLFVNVSGADINYSAIFSGGNVGISTISPTERLDVVGNLKFSGALMPNNLPGTPGQVLTSTGGTTAPTWTTPSGGGFSTTNTIPKGNGTGLVASQIFDDGTNVGIGTVSPAQSLDVGAGNINVRTGNYMIAGTTVLNNAGVDNIFVGAFAGIANTSNANSFIGVATGQSNTSGSHNTFVGSIAGKGNTTASDNTFVGQSAGTLNTIGAQNTFIGSGNAPSNTSGTNNTFVGEGTGKFSATGSDNTFLGRSAGSSNVGGNKNILIGSNADVGAPNLVNAMAIGANTVVSTSNSMVLGDNSVNVGIGTSSPAAKLDVVGGNINVSGKVTNSTTTGAGVNMMPIAYFCVIGSATPSLGAAKTSNVTGVTFVGTGDYKYTITGEDFSTITNYVVVATLIGSGGGQIRVTSTGTNLEILTYNASGASLTNQSYSVVVYKP